MSNLLNELPSYLFPVLMILVTFAIFYHYLRAFFALTKEIKSLKNSFNSPQILPNGDLINLLEK